jgi:hypothetical protein
MASNFIKTLDPVQGLIDYVQDIKPYHTKVMEVLIEYVYDDAARVSMPDTLDMVIDLTFTDVMNVTMIEAFDQTLITDLPLIGGFDVGGFDMGGMDADADTYLQLYHSG